MWTRILLTLLLALGGWAVHSPPAVYASCEVQTSTPTYSDGQFIGADLCDVNGNKKVTTAAAGGATGGTANAGAPTLSEGGVYGFFLDLAGNMKVMLMGLISGEDQTNNLLMTSGGAARITQILGTGGVPSTATNGTTAAQILPVGMKTFQGVVSCTGTCVQTQEIRGGWTSTYAAGDTVVVCTITLSGSTKVSDWCATDRNFVYWYVNTTLTSGTTPLAGIFVQY